MRASRGETHESSREILNAGNFPKRKTRMDITSLAPLGLENLYHQIKLLVKVKFLH